MQASLEIYSGQDSWRLEVSVKKLASRLEKEHSHCSIDENDVNDIPREMEHDTKEVQWCCWKLLSSMTAKMRL